jgi:APA family basic amino acid/polyamine antiporter
LTAHKTIGLATLVSLVIANMIGAGVFTTSGFAMGDLGTSWRVIAAWLVGGGLALCGAMSYGMLARLIPVSGGEYLFLSRNIHPLAGFIAGWISLLAGFTAPIAFAAITLEVYTLPESLSNGALKNTVASAAILSAALLHGFQARHGAVLQNAAVALKLVLIAGFLGVAVLSMASHPWEGITAMSVGEPAVMPFSIAAFATTLMWVSFSYSGFNAAVYVASEADDARARVPAAMVLACLLVMLIYLLLNAVFVFAPAAEAIAYKQDVAAIAAHAIGGNSLSIAVRIIIVIALFTSVSAMMMAGPRVYARMAEDGLMPRILRYTKAAPGAAIAVQALLAVVVVWIAGLRELLSYLGITLSLSAAATVASLFVLARKHPDEFKSLRGYPVLPAIYVGFTLLFILIAATRNPWEVVAALVTLLSGALVYWIWKGYQAAG